LGDSVFFRLLVTTVADEAAERLIYLDADCLVVDDLVELTTMNLDAYSLGAVVDLQCTEEHKQGLRLGYEDDYFNNGVMVYNLAQARARELEQRLVAYVNAPDIANNYIDQDAISVVLRGEIRALPLRYNVVPALFYLNDSNRRAMIESRSFGQKRFYEADVIRTARTKPAIIHFVGSKLYGRPWLDFCHHPWRDTWRALKANTPWRDTPLLPSHLTPIQRLFAFCVRLAMRTFPAAWLDAFLRRHPR
jgi:lipopolysaccharide biosynthesis glycosyltransferase